MTIASQIQDYADGLEDAYDAVNDMQGTIPQDRNMDNLDAAIRTIPQNQGTTYTAGNGINISAQDEISIDDTVVQERAITFYADTMPDSYDVLSQISLYKDSGLSVAATYQDVADALTANKVDVVYITGTFTLVWHVSFYMFEDDFDNPGQLASVTFTTNDGGSTDGELRFYTNSSSPFSPSSAALFDVEALPSHYTYTLPTASSSTKGGVKVGSTLSISNQVLNAKTMTGATSSVAGAAGLVPAPTTSDPDKFLKGDGTWATPSAGSSALTVWLTHSGSTYSMWEERAGTTAISIADVYAAFEAGQTVIFREKPYTTDGIATLVSGTRYQMGNNYEYKFYLSYINLDAVNDGGVSVRQNWVTLLTKSGTNGSGNQMTGRLYDSSLKSYQISFDSPNQGEAQIFDSNGTPLEGSDVNSIRITNSELWSFDSGTFEENYYTIVDKFSDGTSPVLYVTNGTKTYKFLWANSYDNYCLYWLIENQEKLTAGSNISIAADGKTISATDTTYTAGTGISISAQNVISATGGNAATIFYYDDVTEDLYKDDLYTTQATFSDVTTAYDSGTVIIKDMTYETAYASDGISVVAVDNIQSVFCMMQSSGAQYYVVYSYTPGGTPVWSHSVTELQKKLTAGTNVSISGNVISATDTTYSNFTGATSSVAGAAGLVPAPAAGDEAKALHGDGTWKDTTAKLVEMSYGEANAWTKFINAYNAGSIVYCRASSNANPASGSQTRKAFMAYVNNAASPTSVEFQYVRSVSSKTEAQPVDQVFVYTLTNTNGGTWSVASRNMGPKIAAGTGISVSYSNGTYTISLA